MRNLSKITLLMIAALLAVLVPKAAYADYRNDRYDRHDRHDRRDWHDNDRHSNFSIRFSLWPDRNHYSRVVYRVPAREYVLVAPPPVYQPVIVNGITYYVKNGVYYIYNGYYYQDVPPPVVSVVQSVPSQVTTITADGQNGDYLTVNIPNHKGGFTPVTLKRAGDSFIGPQGELYKDFPKIAQLETIYGN